MFPSSLAAMGRGVLYGHPTCLQALLLRLSKKLQAHLMLCEAIRCLAETHSLPSNVCLPRVASLEMFSLRDLSRDWHLISAIGGKLIIDVALNQRRGRVKTE